VFNFSHFDFSIAVSISRLPYAALIQRLICSCKGFVFGG